MPAQPAITFNALKLWFSITVAVGSMAWTGYAQFHDADRELVQRVSALEAHHSDDTGRLSRIESKVDELLVFLGAEKTRRGEGR